MASIFVLKYERWSSLDSPLDQGDKLGRVHAVEHGSFAEVDCHPVGPPFYQPGYRKEFQGQGLALQKTGTDLFFYICFLFLFPSIGSIGSLT